MVADSAPRVRAPHLDSETDGASRPYLVETRTDWQGTLTIGEFELVRTGSLTEAAAFLAAHPDDARPIAGGTALVLFIKHRFSSPRYLVPLWQVPNLDGISFDPQNGLRLGSGVTLSAMLASPVIARHFPALVDALAELGNVRIRNAATIGGHLAHADPNLNLPPALVGYDGSVRAVGPEGERWVPLSELFIDYYQTSLDPAELIAEVHLPTPSATLGAAYLNFKSRSFADWPALGVAGFVEPNGGSLRMRAIVSGGSITPLLVEPTDDSTGSADDLIAHVAARAFELAEPSTDIRGSASYKRDMIREFTRRALALAMLRAGGSAGGEP